MTTFLYDGDGGRVKKTVGSDSTTYIGSLYEVESSGKVTKHFFAGANRIASSLQGIAGNPVISYFHCDHLGSSNVVTNGSGVQTAYTEFTPYGSTFKQTGTYDPKFKFTGKELDQSGMYFYGARYFDPQIGRFISADTIVQAPYDPQSLNRYSYCRNNPINYVDPTGNFWFLPLLISVIKGAVIGAAIGAAVAAATGQNILQGVMTGAIGGAIFGGIGALKLTGIGHTIAHTLGGAAAGAANGAVTGQDVGMNALVGGISAGASEFLGNNVSILKDVAGNNLGAHINNMLRRAFIGSVIGGAASAATGGSFGRGAALGARTSAIAYVANEAMHETEEIARDALNTDKSKEAVIASGNKDLTTGQKRKIFLGKDPQDNDIKNLGLLGKTLGLMTGTPTFSIGQVKYNYEVQEEWASFNMKWNFDTGDLIEKTQIHGTEYWKHAYYYKETHYEPGGMPPDYSSDR